MGLLAPWFLLGLLAVVGPLVAHLRRLSVQKRVDFSAVEFLEARPTRAARRSWEDLVLLFVRACVLALLALAFARPYVRDKNAHFAASRSMRRIVVLLDTSASMRSGELFPQALARIREVVGTLEAEDELEVRTFDRSSHISLAFEEWRRTPLGERRTTLEGLLSSLKPGWAETKLDEALIAVANEHQTYAGPASTEVIVISDFQEGSSLAGLQGFVWPVRLRVRPLVLGAQNRGVHDVSLHWIPPDPDLVAVDAPIRMQLTAGPEFLQGQVKLEVEKAMPSELVVPLNAGVSRVVSIPADGTQPMFVRVKGGETIGSSVWASAIPQRRILVALGGASEFSAREGSVYFLHQALKSLGELRAELVDAALLPESRDAAVSLWVLGGAVSRGLAERIHASLKKGASALVAVDAPKDSGALEWITGRPIGLQESGVDGFSVLGEIRRDHPLFAPFVSTQFSDFTAIRFWKHRLLDLRSAPGAEVLASFDGGDPALVELPVGKGRAFLWASSWRSSEGQWPLSSKCVPFLSACLDIAGGGRGPFFVSSPGEEIVLPEGTTGVRSAVGSFVSSKSLRVRIEEPGVYRIEPEGGVVVVNVAREETRLTPMAQTRLESLGVPCALLTQELVNPLNGTQEESTEVLAGIELEARQGWWRWGLLGVLGLVVFEMIWAERLTRLRKGNP